MNFFIDNPTNLVLVGLAVVSGAALILPILQKRGAKLSLLQATQYINQGKTLVLDVREADEFAAGHLQNAKNIPLKELANRVGEINKTKIKTVIAVCQTGVRSSSATTILSKNGFEQVFSLEGGIAAWKSQGLPVIK